MDITYIPMARGFVYLAAVVDWFSRRVLSHRVSITMEADFCVEALEEALGKHGKPEIFNTDQGSQFTSEAFTGVLIKNGIAISMDGKGAWRDNVFVERLWSSVKYEEVYLNAYDSVGEARASIGRYLDFYNRQRPHSSLDRNTPDEAYFDPATPRGGGMNFPPPHGVGPPVGLRPPCVPTQCGTKHLKPGRTTLINRGNCSDDRSQLWNYLCGPVELGGQNDDVPNLYPGLSEQGVIGATVGKERRGPDSFEGCDRLLNDMTGFWVDARPSKNGSAQLRGRRSGRPAPSQYPLERAEPALRRSHVL